MASLINAVSNIRAEAPGGASIRGSGGKPNLTPPPSEHGLSPIPAGGPLRILKAVFAVLDEAGVAYCVLHGYDRFETDLASDVDCALDPAITRGRLLRLLRQNRRRIGADVVRSMGFFITLAGPGDDGSPCFLELDFAAGNGVENVVYYGARDAIGGRRACKWFWTPSPEIEFGAYLTRSIANGRLDSARAKRLGILYRNSPQACEAEVARHWREDEASRIAAAARSGNWRPILQNQTALRTRLRTQAVRRRPFEFLGNHVAGVMSRLGRLWRPNGMSVVILGPDGAGKSSLIESLKETASPAFSRADCWGFAPPVRRLLGGRATPTNTPHALPPRPLPQSLMRAGYWLAFNTIGYARLRYSLARSTLVLYDRHFIDIFVDPLRYRYGGPKWMIDMVWRLMPKPDIVILLDAAPEVIQARKQEVPVSVTARQLRDYKALIKKMPNGRIVDAAQPPSKVAAEVRHLLNEYLADRTAKRGAG